eukprot:748373-Hanusia_phi.AAC.6
MRLELEQQIHRLHFRGEFNKEVSRQHNLRRQRSVKLSRGSDNGKKRRKGMRRGAQGRGDRKS